MNNILKNIIDISLIILIMVTITFVSILGYKRLNTKPEIILSIYTNTDILHVEEYGDRYSIISEQNGLIYDDMSWNVMSNRLEILSVEQSK